MPAGFAKVELKYTHTCCKLDAPAVSEYCSAKLWLAPDPELGVTEIVAAKAGFRVSEKVSELLPNVAAMTAVVFVPTAEVLTVKVLLDDPAAMLTEAGTVAAAALLDRLIVAVLEAGPLRLNVQVNVAGGVTLTGLQFRPESAAAVA